MSWKDYFYFQKRDRIAIFILLMLIIVSGGIYIGIKQHKNNKPSSENAETDKEFETFLSHLKDGSNTTNTFKRDSQSLDRYPYQEKLQQGQTIELNKADTSDLKKIPGIGSSYSLRIVKYRKLLRGYAHIHQLKEVYGIDEELYNKITPYITLTPDISKIKVNSSSFQELNRHPYINYEQTKIILDIRKRKGNIESIDRLSLLEEFTEDDIKRLTPYLSFN